MKLRILFLCLFFSLHVKAEEPYQIERSKVIEIHSEILKKTYDLSIKLPRNYDAESEKRYPVIYLTDSGYSFPLVSSLTRQMVGGAKIQDSILVGISYSKEERWDISRTRDYTPTNSPNEEIGFSAEAKRASGGADNFLRFINDELFKFIDEKYHTDVSHRVFIGHSFGGLLGAYAVKTTPSMFKFYILSDPSLWYDKAVMLSSDIKSVTNVTTNVLIVSSNPKHPPKRGGFHHNMVANAKLLERQLIDSLPDNSYVKAEIYDGQIHETIYPLAVTQGLLRFVGR